LLEHSEALLAKYDDVRAYQDYDQEDSSNCFDIGSIE